MSQPPERIPHAAGPFVLTAEHASAAVPDPWRPSEADRAVLGTHWGWDIGIGELTRAMALETGSGAVMATVSRLVCDLNRDPAHPSYVVPEVEGHLLSFNAGLDPKELDARTARFHIPYHAAVEDLIATARTGGAPPLLLVMHSFTPVWRGERRWMDLGLIYSPDQSELGARAHQALRGSGLKVAHNEPYAAGGGMAYSLERHGPAAGLPHLEIEVNQALIGEPAAARELGRRLADAFSGLMA